MKPASTPAEEGEQKSLHSKLVGKKLKVKELSYQSVFGKGGGLVRVYTALVSPLQYRVVVVCSRKSSVGEVVATALAKCGKHDQDAKKHKMVLVSGPTSKSPAHYLDHEDKILSVKAGAPPTAMFVLCVSMPGQVPLEILDSIRHNPAYGSAFSPNTRGYLVRREKGQGHRSWCVLDGSTLLCYREEEDEGMKQFESHLGFKGSTVELSSKSKTHIFKVTVGDGAQYSFLATSKDDMLQWVESICSSKTLDPSPLLLHVAGGAVIHTGFMTCQEFACDSSGGLNPTKPVLQRKISDVDFSGTFAAIDYGKHWTVLRSSGLVQCLVQGKPETLFSLSECHCVKVNNPREMREGVDYGIEVENTESKFVLRADLPTEHCDWVLAIEQILKKLDHAQLLHGHRKRESGYVALKRLLLTGQQQPTPAGGRASQLYCFPRIFDDMEDLYDPTNPPPPREHSGPCSELLQKRNLRKEPSPSSRISELPTTPEDNVVPLPPKDYLPPPLPPRKEDIPPPIPPKAGSAAANLPRPISTVSSNSCSEADDDYIMMQSTRSTGPSPMGTPLPTTPRSRTVSQSSSQPITIPNRRSSKKSFLLRADSDSSSFAGSPPHTGSSVHSDARKHSISSSFSFHRQNSNQSLNSSYNNMRQVSVSSVNSETPPLPPRNGNGEKRSSGYASPIFYPSPGRLPQSSTMSGLSSHAVSRSHSEDTSRSDGMTVTELQQYHRSSNGRVPSHHPISKAGSVPRQLVSSYVSEGYESDHDSSAEDLSQLPAGWERGYCEASSRYFYFHSLTGVSTWSLEEVQKVDADIIKPGVGWRAARTEDGRTYYYHEESRKTTWNVKETLA